MLGLGDWGVASAYLLTLAATAFCIIYGCINWNKPSAEEEKSEILEEEEWEKREVRGEAR